MAEPESLFPQPGDPDIEQLVQQLVDGGKKLEIFEKKVLKFGLTIEELNVRLERAKADRDLVTIYGIWFIALTLADRYRLLTQYKDLNDDIRHEYDELRELYKKLSSMAGTEGYVASMYTFSGNPLSDLRGMKTE